MCSVQTRCVGGMSAPRDADDQIQEITDKLKGSVETKVGRSLETFKAVKYASQVVNGTNYFIKVHVGGDEYLHLSAHNPLPVYGDKPELHGVLQGQKLADELKHFD